MEIPSGNRIHAVKDFFPRIPHGKGVLEQVNARLNSLS
jgi:hypothetical protein